MKSEINHLLRKLTAGEEYKEYFNKKMEEHGVDSPDELKSDEEKKKFFDAVDEGYEAKNETD